jgi:pimeloyl-ACP methyl ester carboxylesterase
VIEQLRLAANGLEFATLAAGPASSAQVALCAHGFPETATTFDRTLEYLAARNIRAFAPNMRGYSPSSVEGVARFHVNNLAEDLLALADVVSPKEPIILIGHDWGAFAVYRAAAMRPDRVRHLVTIGIPHPSMIRPSLRLAWGLRHFVVFQARSYAISMLRKNDFAGIDHIYRRWSPTWNVPAEETAPVKETFRAQGSLQGALSYYWHFALQTQEEARRARELDRSVIQAPATFVFGGDDAALSPKHIRERADIFPRGSELVWIEGAGHFAHREKPDAWLKVLDRF